MSCGGLCFSRNWCISLKLASFCIELFTVFCHYPSDLCSTYRNSSCFSPDATDLCLLFFSFPVFLEVCQLYCCFYCIFSLTIYLPSTFHSHNDHTVVHAHESFFLFAQSVHSLTTLPKLSACCPPMSLSLFFFLFKSVC